ncbi:hypothetical protein TRFO_26062 [Tritrichomonas foetus]|uniref:Uncharacterized protein n=1 Tax=Tritrichomonas foetus TaxID=1144522 RepID=A0A1J4K8F8_9EUKA|nr:hypothetical protein TRFO_26062 [Tritrichomonas foetus]|eukprot:OHT05996.1 hypothetical protein TRFO_26062 [Tritrichomonas foetus]
MVFLCLIFWTCLRNIVICNDDIEECIPENFPELSPKSIFYPYINEKFVLALLSNCVEPTSATIVFNQAARISQTITDPIFSINLKQINFYSQKEVIDVNISFQSLQSFSTMNITRINLTILSIMNLPVNSMVYFKNDGNLINGNFLSFEANLQMIPFKDIDKYLTINFLISSTFNFRIESYELDDEKTRSIVIGKDATTYFGKTIYESYFKNSRFHIFFNQYSHNLKINIEHDDNVETLAIPAETFFEFHYEMEERELQPTNISVTIDSHSSFSQIASTIPIIYFITNSFFINIFPNLVTNSISIAFVDSIKSLFYMDPIVSPLAIYDDDRYFDIKTCFNYKSFCYRVNNRTEDISPLLGRYKIMNYLSIIYSEPLKIDFTPLTYHNHYTFFFEGTEKEKSQFEIANFNSKMTADFSLTNCTLTLNDQIISVDMDPILVNSVITNPEKMNILTKSCLISDLSPCENKRYKDVSVYVDVTSDLTVTLSNQSAIFNDTPILMRSDKLYADRIHIILNVPDNNVFKLTFQIDQATQHAYPLTFSIFSINKIDVYFDMDSFTSSKLVKPVELNFTYYFQSTMSFKIHEVPKNVVIKSYSPVDDRVYFDMAPLNISNVKICYPYLLCSDEKSEFNNLFINLNSINPELEIIRNRLDLSANSEIFQTFTIFYPPNTLPSLYNSLYNDLELDKFYKNIELVADSSIITPPIVSIMTDLEFNAESLIIDNIEVYLNKNWKIPVLKMKNNGVLRASQNVTTKYTEVDSLRIGQIRNILFDSLLIKAALYEEKPLTIIFDTDKITIDKEEIPIFTNFSLKFLFTQEKIITRNLKINLHTVEGAKIKDTIFEFENVRTKIEVLISSEYSKISNSPFYTFISSNRLEVEIKNAVSPLRYEYKSTSGEIFEEFPIKNNKILYLCYSNQNLFYDSCFNLSQTIHFFFKRFSSNEELINIIKSSLITTFDELNIHAFSPINISINFKEIGKSSDVLHITGTDEESLISLVFDETCKMEYFSASEIKIKVIDSKLIANTIDLNHGHMDGEVSADILNGTIFDTQKIRGSVSELYLNYTFNEAKLFVSSEIINNSNLQHKNLNENKNVSDNKNTNDHKNRKEKSESFQLNKKRCLSENHNNQNSVIALIGFSKRNIEIDSIDVIVNEIDALNIYYVLRLRKLDELTFSIKEIPDSKTFNFIITLPKYDFTNSFTGKSELSLKFDETWKQFDVDGFIEDNEKIKINIICQFLNKITYYAENVPNIVIVNATNGNEIGKHVTYTKVIDFHQNNNVFFMSFLILIVVIITCGVLLVVLVIKRMKNVKNIQNNFDVDEPPI